MRYLVGFLFLLALVALPFGVSAQTGQEGAIQEPTVEESLPSPEPAPEQPALELKLDDDSVKLAPGSYRLPDREPTFEEMELRVRRAKIGFGVSAGVAGAGLMLVPVGYGIASDGGAPGADTAMIAGAAIALAGAIASYTALGIWIHRKRKLRRMREDHYHRTREAVEVDTSDDAFTVIVTRKYDGDELTGATVFIRHKDSGQRANPYIDAAEIDTLGEVIREHKAKLLRSE